MPTPLSWAARLIDLRTDTLVATTTELFDPAWGKKRSAAGTFRFGVRPGTAFINAVIAAWGGPTYQGAILPYLVEISQDGGTTWDTGGWLEKGRIVLSGPELGAVIDQMDFFSGYDRAYIDHVTFLGVPVDAILYGAPGTIPLGQGGGSLIASGGTFPQLRGFFQQTPGRDSMKGAHRLAFSVITDPFTAKQSVNTDVNSDSISRATSNVLAAAAGVLDPAHPEQFGAHQYFSVDVAHRVVMAGYVGKVPRLTLTGRKKPSECDETVEAALLEIQPTTIEPNLSAMFAQIDLIGGASSHNLPDGGTITDLCIINTDHAANSVGWSDSLCVLAVSTGNEGGGVYYWLHDGALHPMSGLMDVRGLAYDASAGIPILYAATARGVYYRTAGYDAIPWTRLGSLDLDCTKVWVPTSGVVYALVNGPNNAANQASNGVYRNPALGGEDNAASGYAGWSQVIPSGTIVDAAGTDDDLYYVDTTAPTVITHHHAGTDDPAAIDTTKQAKGEHITGLDYAAARGLIFVRTEAGGAGFYYVSVGGATLLSANPQGTGAGGLADTFGPLAVNRLTAYATAINGRFVANLVATDRGIWWTSLASGGQYNPAAGQSGIGDVNAAVIAAGMPQTVLGRQIARLYAASGRSLWISNNGGLNWRDELAQPLDAGAGWQALHKQIMGAYADNDIGALGNTGQGGNGQAVGSIVQVSGPGVLRPPTPAIVIDTGGSGSVVQIPRSNPFALPLNWLLARRLNSRNEFSYRLLDAVSPAPYNAIKLGEAIEIAADDSRGVITASSQLIEAAYRFLAQASRAQLVLNVHTQYSTQEAALRQCITGDMVLLDQTVSYVGKDGTTTTTLCDFQNQQMYVYDWSGSLVSGVWQVDLQIVNSVAFLVLDIMTIISGIANGQSKGNRTRKVRVA